MSQNVHIYSVVDRKVIYSTGGNPDNSGLVNFAFELIGNALMDGYGNVATRVVDKRNPPYRDVTEAARKLLPNNEEIYILYDPEPIY